jgi:predicted alpha/beta-hydrolase family hydrolase
LSIRIITTLTPNSSNWRIAVDGEETSAALDCAIGEKSAALFVAGHGAGSHMDHRSMLQISEVLRERGFDLVRFNFLYREKGGRAPDRMPRLQACFSAVAERARREFSGEKLIIGGRSMGGRVASMLAAEGFACDGLFLLAYPLHPAGDPAHLRDAHLSRIQVPVLCINGTRDTLCRKDLMTAAIADLGWDMHWLDGAGHSFPVTEEVGALAARWLATL